MKFWITLFSALTLTLAACSDNDNNDSNQKAGEDKPVKTVSLSTNVRKVVYSSSGPNLPATGNPYKRISATLVDGEFQITAISGNEVCPQLQLNAEMQIPDVGTKIAKILNHSVIEHYPPQTTLFMKPLNNGYASINVYFDNGDIESIDTTTPSSYEPGVSKLLTTSDEFINVFMEIIEFGHSKSLINTECP